MRGAALALLALLGAAGGAAAQSKPGATPPAGPPPGAQAMAAPEVRAAVIRAAHASLQGLGCPDATLRGSSALRSWQPPAPMRTRDGQPIEAAWVESLDVADCAATTRVSVLASFSGGRFVEAIPGIPGQTRADPLLAADLIGRALRPAAQSLNPGCTSFRISDTTMVAAPAGPRSPWQERWMLDLCGRPQPVDVTFTPDATGTGFSARIPRG